MGENPAMSDPDANHARGGLAKLEMLVVQDIFLTETAYLADVILPASAWPEKMGTVTNTDRMVQLGRRALDLPGDAKQDLWIIQQLAKRLGLHWNYAGAESGVESVYNEMRTAMNSMAGISWERLERESSVTYPCVGDDDPGQPVVFTDDFPAKRSSPSIAARSISWIKSSAASRSRSSNSAIRIRYGLCGWRACVGSDLSVGRVQRKSASKRAFSMKPRPP